jgi:two-component system, OmpR family, sensor kinase
MSIRLRLTAVFALAMLLVLAGAAAFVYVRMRADLTESVDEGLRVRAEAPVGDRSQLAPYGAFRQVLTLDGRTVSAETHGPTLPRGPALDRAERRLVVARGHAAVARSPFVAERRIPGMQGSVRVLARPVRENDVPLPLRGEDGGAAVVVVGQSLEERDETLADLVAAFAIGGPLAVLLASALGYALAALALAPVERMRRRAAGISLTGGDDERLPLPSANDEIRRLGETLNEMLDRLRQAFARERRFVADASHELRTPVAVVKTELEGALRTGDYGPQVRESLVAAVEECDRLARLAEDLLTADGSVPVRRERLAVAPLLEATRERYADRATHRARPLRVAAPADLDVSADPLRLQQALGNLVDNALRHGSGEIVLSARRDGVGVTIEVADGGPGFAPALFERFARGDAARTRGGTGLGLAIVRSIAAAHGGEATVAGPPTAVRIWLPDEEETA